MSVKHFLFLCGATLPASFALLRDGFFSSSDGMIHLYRVFELDRALRAGIFFPRWFPLSGYGYGLPVLNYYPPLAYYIAEIFNLLGAGYIGSVKCLIAFTFCAAALSMFVFSRDLLGLAPAFVAAIAFTYLPYLLSDAYIRGNLPEMLAMALIPFALAMFRRLYPTRSAKYLVLSALAFAAIILTHHLTAMLAAPLIGAYVIFLFALERDWKKLLACAGAVSLSLALSAFYWVPAIAELNLVFVGPASLARFLVSRLVTLEQFFTPSLAYAYLPQSDALQHSAGFPQTVAALLVGLVVLMSYLLSRLNSPKSRSESSLQDSPAGVSTYSHMLFFFVSLLAAIIMLLDFSASLWYAIPTLRFMQFPWRFQVVAGISIAFLLGVLAGKLPIASYRFRTIALSLISLFLLYLALVNLPDRSIPLTDPQVNLLRSDDPDYVQAQMGWSWTREFVPAAVQDENVAGSRQRTLAPQSPRAVLQVQIENDGLLARAMRVSAPEPTEISLHQFFFPGWQGYIDGAAAPTYPAGSLGLVTVNVPPGDHRIEFRFDETPYRAALDAVSILAFVGVGVWLFLAERRAFIAVSVAVVLLGALMGFQTRPALAAHPTPLSAEFGHNAALIGYSADRQGDALYVTLEWFALREMQDDFIVTVQLVDAAGKIIAQSDALTDWGVTPTSRWQRGELVTDRRALRGVPRGSYRLIVGMYLPREDQIENLAAYARSGDPLGNQVELGSIQIEK